jgi:hypothetical protein
LAATANTGSGGGGGVAYFANASVGGNGGSGIVILAYPSEYPDLTVGTGLTYTRSTSSRSGFKVYSFTAGTGTVKF